MVRRLTAKRTPAWKALLAILVAAGGVLWHLLACTESPMAYSPDGRQLAFVTMEPYGSDDLALRSRRVYRLFVLDEQSKLRLLEQSTDYMLTAPAYSPDGKRLYYLRIPLLTEEDANRVGEALREQAGARSQAASQSAPVPWPPGPARQADQPDSRPVDGAEDRTLPSVATMKEFLEAVAISPVIPAELIVRDIQRNEVLGRVDLDVPLSPVEKNDTDLGLLFSYLLTRPQVADGGRRVLVCTNDVVIAVDASTGARSVLAAPVAASALSPDGRTLAVLQEEAVGFIQTDGSRALYVRYEGEASPSGLAWADGRTVAILRADGGDGNAATAVLDRIRSDGTVLESRSLQIEGQGHDNKSGELAISPDGRHMVVSFESEVYFMTAEAKVVKSWRQEGYLMVQPTFSPDSKRVAFKLMGEDEKRVTGIVFFTPQGERKAVVPVPAIDPATTRPGEE